LTVKLLIFLYTCLFAFFETSYHNYFLVRQLLISRKSVSQWASYSPIFNPLCRVISKEQHEKYLYNNPAIMENMECLIVITCTPANNLKVGVLLDHIASLCSVSLPALLTFEAIFQAKNNVRSTPASTVLAQVSCRSHNTHTTNRHLCSSGERNGAQRRTKVSSGKTMMQALGLLWFAKKHISG